MTDERIESLVPDTAPPGMSNDWRDSYPVLRLCLSEGRFPSSEEIDRVAARMGREIGVDEGSRIRADAPAARRRKLKAAARTALIGRRDPGRRPSRFPLVVVPPESR